MVIFRDAFLAGFTVETESSVFVNPRIGLKQTAIHLQVSSSTVAPTDQNSSKTDARQPVIQRIVYAGLMPHWHPEDRVYTVISGVFYIGLGDEFDADKLQAYSPGSVIVLPGDTQGDLGGYFRTRLLPSKLSIHPYALVVSAASNSSPRPM